MNLAKPLKIHDKRPKRVFGFAVALPFPHGPNGSVGVDGERTPSGKYAPEFGIASLEFGPLPARDTPRESQTADQQHQEDHHKDEEQNLGDGKGRAGDSGKAKNARNKADNQKDDCPPQHVEYSRIEITAELGRIAVPLETIQSFAGSAACWDKGASVALRTWRCAISVVQHAKALERL